MQDGKQLRPNSVKAEKLDGTQVLRALYLPAHVPFEQANVDLTNSPGGFTTIIEPDKIVAGFEFILDCVVLELDVVTGYASGPTVQLEYRIDNGGGGGAPVMSAQAIVASTVGSLIYLRPTEGFVMGEGFVLRLYQITAAVATAMTAQALTFGRFREV